MDHFAGAATVRLRSHNRSYLISEDDEDGDGDEDGSPVKLAATGASRSARWSIEHVPGPRHHVRIRSWRGRYLSASERNSLLGIAGRKVHLLPRPEACSEWEPVSDGARLKLRSVFRTFLRGNGNSLLGPYKGTVTHGDPKRTITQESVYWDVEILEASGLPTSQSLPPRRENPAPPRPADTLHRRHTTAPLVPSEESSTNDTPEFESSSGSSSPAYSPVPSSVPAAAGVMHRGSSMPPERTIYYYVLDEEGEEDYDYPMESFTFHGSSVQELTRKVEKMTGLTNLILCIRDVINNDKLRRLRLKLPPNRSSMTVVAVRSSTPVAKSLDM